MGKKNADVLHIGKRSFWSGRVRTLCGLTFEPGNNKEEPFWLPQGPKCPACKQAKKEGRRL